MPLPKHFEEDKNLRFDSPFLMYFPQKGKPVRTNLEVFKEKAHQSIIEREFYHKVQPQYNLM